MTETDEIPEAAAKITHEFTPAEWNTVCALLQRERERINNQNVAVEEMSISMEKTSKAFNEQNPA